VFGVRRSFTHLSTFQPLAQQMYVRQATLVLLLIALVGSQAHLMTRSLHHADAETKRDRAALNVNEASQDSSSQDSSSVSEDDSVAKTLTTRNRRSAKRNDYVKPGACGSNAEVLRVCFTCGRYTGSFEMYEQCCEGQDVHSWCTEWLAVGERK